MVFRRHHCKEGMADVDFITRELGFDNPSLTMHRELAERQCTSLPFASAFTGRLLSLYGFPLQVSRCSEGSYSQPFLSQTGILYAPTRRATTTHAAPPTGVMWVSSTQPSAIRAGPSADAPRSPTRRMACVAICPPAI